MADFKGLAFFLNNLKKRSYEKEIPLTCIF